MRGSPVIRGLAVVAALLLLLVPLVRTTSGRAAAAAPPTAAKSSEARTVALRITSSSTPFAFSVSHLGNVVWEGESTEPHIEKEVKLPFPPEGIDLLVSAEWETSGPSALELTVERDGLPSVAQTVWGERDLAEVLTFR